MERAHACGSAGRHRAHRQAAAARSVADTLRGRLRQIDHLGGRPFQLDASVGIALFPGDGDDVATLLAHADGAMYAVKRRSRADAG